MRYFYVICLIFISQISISQNLEIPQKESNQGKLFFYWGWNVEAYSKSNIRFWGDTYDFILKDVKASDRNTKFGLYPYFHLSTLTIPQYNARIGYYYNDHWSISAGVDHMKYVVNQYQTTSISGVINDTTTAYFGMYSDETIELSEDFLQFEHTDGLNYIDVELRRFDQLLDLNKLKINAVAGLGAGILLTRTDASLLNYGRHDEFHVSGYGLNTMLGLNFTFFDVFFMQTELKGGFVNLPYIRTTFSASDKAKQSFFYGQYNLVFGANIRLFSKKRD
jgi:hypothetical protein